MKILSIVFLAWCSINISLASELPAPLQMPVAISEIVVEKELEEAYHTTHYLARENHSDASLSPNHTQCQLVWSVRRSPRFTQGFSFSEKSNCQLSIQAQQPYRAALLQQLLQDAPGLLGVRGFAWGSLLRGDGNDAFARRMQEMLQRDSGWQMARKKRGFQQKEAYILLPKLLQEKQVFAELHALFAANGLQLRVGDVEKIQFAENGLPSNFLLYFCFAEK